MVVRNSDAGSAVTPRRWGGDDAHSQARKPGLRSAQIHDVRVAVAVVVHSHTRRDHARRRRGPCRPWDNETCIRRSRVRLRPREQRLGMRVYFSVVTPAVCIVHACRIELRNNPQGYYAVVGIRPEEAWHCRSRVYPCCERVAVEGDAADGFKFVAPELGDGQFEAVCSLQFCPLRIDRWHGTDVVYVNAVASPTWKEDVVLVEKGKDGRLQQCRL